MTVKEDIREIVKRAKAELRGSAADMATPIDYEDLIARGVLKKSDGWYILLKPDELPQHAWAKVKSIARISENGRYTEKLQFRNPRKPTKRVNELAAFYGEG